MVSVENGRETKFALAIDLYCSICLDSYKDPSGRGNVRRLLVIAAIPIFLTNGISVKQAREGVCYGLQGAINSGEFIRLAKTSRSKSKRKQKQALEQKQSVPAVSADK